MPIPPDYVEETWEAPVITGGTPATPARMNNLEAGVKAATDALRDWLLSYATDVDSTTPTDGDVLAWDDVSSKWVPTAGGGGGGATTLNGLTDVNAPSPTDAYVLTWDAGTSKWIASAAPGAGGVTEITDLTDVDTTTAAPTDGQSLVWDNAGSKWVPGMRAPLASPTFTGTPAAPTPSAGDSSTKLATTAFVAGEIATSRARYAGINAQTGTTYTPVLADEGKLVTLTNAAAITLTLPQDSAVAFPVNSTIDFAGLGAGLVTIAAGTGATKYPAGTVATRAQYSAVTVIKIAANTWLVVGDLA